MGTVVDGGGLVIPGGGSVSASQITDSTATGRSLVTASDAASGRAVLHSRTLALSGATASAGAGTATAATGTVTLPGATTTATFSDEPRLRLAHAGDPHAWQCTYRVATLSGATVNQILRAYLCHDGASSYTAAQVLFQVYGSGQIDVHVKGSAVYTAYVDGTVPVDGTLFVRVRVNGGTLAVYTGVGASAAAATWSLRHTAALPGGALPLSSASSTYLVVSLAATAGAAGTVTGTVDSVVWDDLV